MLASATLKVIKKKIKIEDVLDINVVKLKIKIFNLKNSIIINKIIIWYHSTPIITKYIKSSTKITTSRFSSAERPLISKHDTKVNNKNCIISLSKVEL